MMTITGGSTDVTTYFVMRLAADGTEATGLTITNFDLQYTRSGVAPTAKVDATALAATDSAHGDNQAIEIDATDQPGLYRVDWPDAAFAAGVKEVLLSVKCATCFTEHLRVLIDAPVNSTKLSGSSTAADNAEVVFDTDFADNYNTTANKWEVDITHSLGVAITDSDFTIASATASTVVLPSTYADSTSLPDDDRHIWNALQVVDGTGQGQVVLLTTAGAGVREYNVLSGTMVVELDNTSKCVVLGSWRANTTHVGGTVQTAGDVPALVTTVDTVVDAIKVKTDFLPSATAGAAGGVFIAGSNAATTVATLTVTGAFTISDGLVVARSSSNTSAVTFTGNGTGHGFVITSGSGATGDGVHMISAATNGRGLRVTGTGTEPGFSIVNNLAIDGEFTASTFGASVNDLPWNADWDTQVESEVADALITYRLDELLAADSDIDGAAPPTVGSVFHELLSKTAGSFTFDQTTDSLEAIRDRGDAAWTTATGFSTHSAADVWSSATRILTAGTNIVLPSNGLSNVTAWTVNITGSVSGSVGSVTGAVGSVTGNVSGSVASVVATVDANITEVNSVVIDGAGTAGDPWGPA
jgi:hypothetical protein